MVKTILCLMLTSTGVFSAVDLSGHWSGFADRGGRKIPLIVTLTQSGGMISGTIRSDGAQAAAPIENPTLHSDQLEFEVHDREGYAMRFDLVAAGTRMTGKAALGDLSGRIELVKEVAPVLIHKEEPEYTGAALQAHLQGTVILSAQIGPQGQITDIRVTQELGMGLDEKAIECVKRWKFKPGYKGDQPAAFYATFAVNFVARPQAGRHWNRYAGCGRPITHRTVSRAMRSSSSVGITQTGNFEPSTLISADLPLVF